MSETLFEKLGGEAAVDAAVAESTREDVLGR